MQSMLYIQDSTNINSRIRYPQPYSIVQHVFHDPPSTMCPQGNMYHGAHHHNTHMSSKSRRYHTHSRSNLLKLRHSSCYSYSLNCFLYCYCDRRRVHHHLTLIHGKVCIYSWRLVSVVKDRVQKSILFSF